MAAGEDLEKRVVDVVTGSRGRRRGRRRQRKRKLILNKLRICTGRHSRSSFLVPWIIQAAESTRNITHLSRMAYISGGSN
jgi:hypothetical protein